jgi:HAD superfamily hydrolase (TIGR01509 family)
VTKAIIFDCFGVLTTEAWLAFKTQYFGHDQALLDRASAISWEADRGAMSYGEFMSTIAHMAGITPAAALQAIAHNVPDEPLFAYIRRLKRQYKLGLLSNVAGDYLRKIFTAEQLELFDAIVLSFETGFIKPQPEAFETAARELGVKIEECVFIDDQQRQVDGATRAGMAALLYQDAEHLQIELPKLLQA